MSLTKICISFVAELKGELQFLQETFDSYKTSVQADMDEKWQRQESEIMEQHTEEIERLTDEAGDIHCPSSSQLSFHVSLCVQKLDWWQERLHWNLRWTKSTRQAYKNWKRSMKGTSRWDIRANHCSLFGYFDWNCNGWQRLEETCEQAAESLRELDRVTAEVEVTFHSERWSTSVEIVVFVSRVWRCRMSQWRPPLNRTWRQYKLCGESWEKQYAWPSIVRSQLCKCGECLLQQAKLEDYEKHFAQKVGFHLNFILETCSYVTDCTGGSSRGKISRQNSQSHDWKCWTKVCCIVTVYCFG